MQYEGDQLYLFYCHNPEHEDQGMMVNHRVTAMCNADEDYCLVADMSNGLGGQRPVSGWLRSPAAIDSNL